MTRAKAYKQKQREARLALKAEQASFPSVKPTSGRKVIDEDDKFHQANKHSKINRTRRVSAGYTEGKFKVPIIGTTINWEALKLEHKLIKEKPLKTKFERPTKKFKRFGKTA